jgi:Na+-driven multidrug efflux pump
MTVSGARAMRDSARGEGERREAARQRRKWLIVSVLFALGLFTGFYMGYQDGAAAALGRPAAWSPTVAALLAAAYLAALLIGGILMNGVMDEEERQRAYRAVSFAGTVLIVVYPTWFLLWKGGFVTEPVHWVVFVLFWLSLALASLWYRFR